MSNQLIFMQPTRYASGDNPGETVKAYWDYVDGMQWNVETDVPSRIYIRGHLAVQNEGSGTSTNAMVGATVWLNGEHTTGFQQTANLDRQRHYHDFWFNGSIEVGAGINNVAIMAYKDHFGSSFPIYVKAPQYSGVWLEVVPLPEAIS